jgi:low temperature requirement protein LtrA
LLVKEDRSASFIELFFDLVFVFGVTQVVASIHGHLDWSTLWHAGIVFAIMWWAWTQYTWLAGYSDSDGSALSIARRSLVAVNPQKR